MTQPYDKEWRSIDDQLALLHHRGLSIPDQERAKAFLRHVNYYRLAGYCLVFEAERHRFDKGVTFEQIESACEFDRLLRDLLGEALEVIELDVRSTIAYTFGEQHGAFGHTDRRNFFERFTRFAEWTDKLHGYATDSRETFVEHFKKRYSEFPDLPIWVISELMSFGSVSRMYAGMLKSDQKRVSARYRLQPKILASWLHHLVHVRNVCAHHGRVWDKDFAITPELPPAQVWSSVFIPNESRVFVTLLILRKMLSGCEAASSFTKEWMRSVESHMKEPPEVKTVLQKMGMTDQWALHPVWRGEK